MPLDIANVLDQLVSSVLGLRRSFPVVTGALNDAREQALSSLLEYAGTHGHSIPSESKHYYIDVGHRGVARELHQKYNDLSNSSDLVPRTLLVAMLSEFEHCLAGLLQCILEGQPDLLQNITRQYTAAELLEAEQRARESGETAWPISATIVALERNAFIASGYRRQFQWFGKALNLDLLSLLPFWGEFVELRERRNAIVHSSGQTSDRYIKSVPKKVRKSVIEKYGNSLELNRTYFFDGANVIIAMAVSVAQILWRKLLPDSLATADDHLAHLSFDLLSAEDYELSSNILDFALSGHLPISDDAHRRCFIINSAIAKKFQGKPETAHQLLQAEDWSASGPEYRIAFAVLTDQIDDVVMLMKRLGSSSETFTRVAFQTWPLFREARKYPEFIEAFESIFSQPLSVGSSNHLEIDSADVVSSNTAEVAIQHSRKRKKKDTTLTKKRKTNAARS